MRKTTPVGNLRRARTLSQAEMAKLLGVAQQTYCKYETGKLMPPIDMQARIAAILGASATELFPPSVAA